MAWKGKIQALNPYLTNALENVIGTCWTAYSPFSPSPSYHHHILSIVYYSCRQSAPILHSLLYSVQKRSGSHIRLVEKQSHSAARERSFTLRKSSKLTGKLMQQDREQRREWESAEAIGKYKKNFLSQLVGWMPLAGVCNSTGRSLITFPWPTILLLKEKD